MKIHNLNFELKDLSQLSLNLTKQVRVNDTVVQHYVFEHQLAENVKNDKIYIVNDKIMMGAKKDQLEFKHVLIDDNQFADIKLESNTQANDADAKKAKSWAEKNKVDIVA